MIIIIVLGSLVSLIGTMAGASLGVVINKPSNKMLGAIIGFAGGLMLAVVVFDLIPEAIEMVGLINAIFFSVIGIMTIIFVDNIFEKAKFTSNKHIKVAFMVALGLMIHNFPEGIIMGCGFVSGTSLGLKMSIVIALHDIPEGIAVSAPLMASRVKISKILFYAFITALPTAAGVWLGAWVGTISYSVLGDCLAFASGIMLYVVCREMLPESSKLWEGISGTLGILGGILLGLLITTVL
jgi:ZIP family zinc transporter